MASQLLGIKTRFTNDLGSPLVGGQVYTYFAGTSTNQDSYSDAALTVPNTNPVILDDTGSADIFLKGSYRIRVFDKSGRFIEEQDNVTQAASQSDATEINNEITAIKQSITDTNAALSEANTEIDAQKLDTGITVTAQEVGQIEESLSDKNKRALPPQSFGVVGNGINDDTEGLRAYHNYCNLRNIKAVYTGLSVVVVQADAQIDVTTNVDFLDAEFKFLNGIVAVPDFRNPKLLFKFYDPLCPLVDIAEKAVTATNLIAGSRTIGADLFTGDGYLIIKCSGFQIPNRDKKGTVAYEQSFRTHKGGQTSLPLSADLSAYNTTISAKYRKASKNKLTIENFSVPEYSFNNQVLFDISRCGVHIKNTNVVDDPDNKVVRDDISRLIRINYASDIVIDDYLVPARTVSYSEGSYTLNLNCAADIHVNRMSSLNGWGTVGSNHVNGVYFNNCVINRVDAHAGGHNMFVDKSVLHDNGMVYGWGGGVLSVTNTQLINSGAVSVRPDYGGQLFGSIYTDNIDVVHTTSNGIAIVNLLDLGANVPINAPYSITVSNVKRSGVSGGGATTLYIPLRISVSGTKSVRAPSAITIDGYTQEIGNWRFQSPIDINNMSQSQAGRTEVNYRNILASSAPSTTHGHLEETARSSIDSPATMNLRAYNCTNLLITSKNDSAVINVSNSTVNGVSNSSKSSISVSHCLLDANASASTKFGATRSGDYYFTTLKNCELAGSKTWDMTNVEVSQGNTIRNYVPTCTLPCTINEFFTGYKSSASKASV